MILFGEPQCLNYMFISKYTGTNEDLLFKGMGVCVCLCVSVCVSKSILRKEIDRSFLLY